jgi:sulfite reductase (ferredoxin)
MASTTTIEIGGGPQFEPELRAEIQADIDKFRTVLARYLAGEVDEDRFRIFRLNNGIYGQRQGGRNQMVRVKLPHGSVWPEQLEALGRIADTYSRGWGHITTRQNVQFHFVELERVPDLLEELADAGLTTREACGDTVRNITGCHLAGACPFEVLDITAWAEAAFRHFLHHPYAQRLPRKFKINFSGCATDCGQAMFNDVGVVAVGRPSEDGTVEPGFRVFVAGGLGANPKAAQALEEFTPREQLMETIEACLRVFDHYGNRDNKIRARMKWLLETMGADELRTRILKERKFLLASSSTLLGIPKIVRDWGDEPAGMATAPGADVTPVGMPVTLTARDPYDRWLQANVVRGAAKGTVSAVAHARLGDITGDQFRALAQLQRDVRATVRVTNRQNVVFRDLTDDQLPSLYQRLADIAMDQPGAELARDVVSCPGTDTCNLAVTQSRGLAGAIGDALEEAGLAEVGGVRVNISGCSNSCGQHHIADIGFQGVERRAHQTAAPGYQMYLGGRVGQMEVEFGQKALRLPAKRTGDAVVRVVGRFANERVAGERFDEWLFRSGGAKAVAAELQQLDEWPTPADRPDFYIDYDEQGPYVADVGEGECAGG